MQLIRVGRRDGGDHRCAYCHGALETEGPVACDACGAQLHPDCWDELGRCPAVGCAGTRGSIEPTDAVEPRAWPPGPVALSRWRAPPAGARQQIHSSLTSDANVSLGCAGVLSTVLVALVINWSWTWDVLSHHKGRSLSWPESVCQLMVVFGLLVLVLLANLSWLAKLPEVRREVERLLDSTRPVPMTLRLRVEGSSKHKRTLVDLEGGGQRLSVPVQSRFASGGRWIEAHDGRVVLVYGLPPPGPYVLEFEDGRLALLHPD